MNDTNVAQLIALKRPTLSAAAVAGFPDHEFYVCVDRFRGIGSLRFLDEDGDFFARGSEGDHDPGVYSLMGTLMEFPEYSDVAIELVRQAGKEFLLSGGDRPTCVAWQEHPAF